MTRRLLPLLPLLLAAALPAADNLLGNGDCEAGADGQAEGWPKGDGISWEAEEGNHFLRLRAGSPGAQVVLYRQLPVAGIKALKLGLRARWNGVERGTEKWHDARIVLDFKDAAGKKVGSARPIIFVGSSTGWEPRETAFAVPAGATVLAFMPALFHVAAGTLELDDLVLTAAETP
jgi:hypothetical protein